MPEINKGSLKSENAGSVEDIINRQVGRNGGITLAVGHAAIVNPVACFRAAVDGTTITFSQTFDNRDDQAKDTFTVVLKESEYFDLITPMESLTVTTGSGIASFS